MSLLKLLPFDQVKVTDKNIIQRTWHESRGVRMRPGVAHVPDNNERYDEWRSKMRASEENTPASQTTTTGIGAIRQHQLTPNRITTDEQAA